MQFFFYMFTVTNVATVQSFYVTSCKVNVLGVCTVRNYVQKWITKLNI